MKYPEIAKSTFIEHMTPEQQKELYEILDKHFVKKSYLNHESTRKYFIEKGKVKEAIEREIKNICENNFNYIESRDSLLIILKELGIE